MGYIAEDVHDVGTVYFFCSGCHHGLPSVYIRMSSVCTLLTVPGVTMFIRVGIAVPMPTEAVIAVYPP